MVNVRLTKTNTFLITVGGSDGSIVFNIVAKDVSLSVNAITHEPLHVA